ncbi:MAG TPA: hypothetical protein PLD88_01380, partial [Candidatus Berkiella sp.]|nr:hypothetical protein [Candidatus Berkiella sp.]
NNQIDTGAGGTTGSITLNNGGVLSLQSSATTAGALTNTFIADPGSVYAVQIQGPGDFGKMQVNAGGATLNAGSFVSAQLGSGQFIPAGTAFDIITGGPVVDNSTLAQPSSLTVRFDKSVVAGN